ncbi:hypothetical protein ACVWZK_006556 [Bradyrhizobium sp. GM0.4]
MAKEVTVNHKPASTFEETLAALSSFRENCSRTTPPSSRNMRQRRPRIDIFGRVSGAPADRNLIDLYADAGLEFIGLSDKTSR